jgi:hypothetical protein
MASIIAPAYGTEYDERLYGRDYDADRNTSLRIVRAEGGHHGHSSHVSVSHRSERERSREPPAPVVEETEVHHLHHHVHHNIDHGVVDNLTGSLSMRSSGRSQYGGSLHRKYSMDDIDIVGRGNATTVITATHSHGGEESDHSRRRHRHRHRSRRGSVERTRITRSEVDYVSDEPDWEDVTIVDVPNGSRRLYVNVEKQGRSHTPQGSMASIDWRRERGIRRSRGLGNELWTEITKDLVTREAIEELGYNFEETDYFYYIFEYLDRAQVNELCEVTQDIRRERARDIEYESISNAGASNYGHSSIGRRHRDRSMHRDDLSDSRTEIIIESGADRPRRRYYH